MSPCTWLLITVDYAPNLFLLKINQYLLGTASMAVGTKWAKYGIFFPAIVGRTNQGK